MRKALICLALLPMTACVSTVATVVKAPFQVAGKAVDLATTSQSEADRNYGRKMRKAEEREGRERRAWAARCHSTPGAADCQAYTGYTASRAER